LSVFVNLCIENRVSIESHRPRSEKHGKTVSKGYPHIVAELLREYHSDGSEFLISNTICDRSDSTLFLVNDSGGVNDTSVIPQEDPDVAWLRIIGKDLWKKRAGVIANGFSSGTYSFKDQ